MDKKHQARVAEFMQKAGQTVRNAPTIPSVEERVRCARLILEEASELIHGLGCIIIEEETLLGKVHNVAIDAKGTPDLVKIADGIADTSVVIHGAANACGINMEPIIEGIDLANLRKFGPGGYRRDDGKWIKPPDFKNFDIAQAIKDQSNEKQ